MNGIKNSKWNDSTQKPPLIIQIAFFFFLICVNSLVGKFVVFSFEMAPGVSYYYVVVAVMIAFTLWFGLWGAFAAYIGCFIGSGLLCNIPPFVDVYWSLADFWQVLIPFVACRYFNVDIALTSTRDLKIVLIFGVFINNFVGAVWGSLSLVFGGVISVSEFYATSYAWFIGNIIICLIMLPFLLHFLTPKIRHHELFVKRFWT